MGAVAIAAALVGCKAEVEASTSPTGVSEAKLEQTLQQKITDEVGSAPDDIDCPGGLDGEKGAIRVCELTAGPDKLDVTVTVTSVEGSTVNFEYEIGEIKDPA